MRIILLGPPGSGKADLAAKVAAHYDLAVITPGGVLDNAASATSELGRLAREARDSCRVSDELLLALLRIQLPRPGTKAGFVMVDMPRNAQQADVLDTMLGSLGCAVDVVFNLEVDRDDLMERLVGRITCDNCGAEYNLYINPPMVEGVCDHCGARVIRRPNDYEETISNRLRIYEGQMAPLLQYYELHEKLHRMDANGPLSGLWKRVRKVVDTVPVREPEPVAAAVDNAAQQAAGKAQSARKAGGRSGAKKTAARKAPAAGKAGAKKTAAQRPAAKKAVAKKAVAKKPAAKKAAAKKTMAKKAAAKKAAARKVVPKKAVAKKSAAKKAPPRKAAAKKAAAKKVVKKAVARKAPTKKAVPKKTPVKKAATGKAAAKKKAAPKKRR